MTKENLYITINDDHVYALAVAAARRAGMQSTIPAIDRQDLIDSVYHMLLAVAEGSPVVNKLAEFRSGKIEFIIPNALKNATVAALAQTMGVVKSTDQEEKAKELKQRKLSAGYMDQVRTPLERAQELLRNREERNRKGNGSSR